MNPVVAQKSRQGFRLQISNEKQRVDGMIKGSVAKDINVMKRTRDKMKHYIDKISQLDTVILQSIEDDADIDAELQKQNKYNDDALESLMILEQNIEASESPAISGRRGSVASSGSDPSAHSSNVHLPKIQIPKFSGDLLQWQEFWDIYKATVHDDHALSKVQKFSYLRGCLHGEAFSMVQGYQLSEANYVCLNCVL